MTRAGRRRAGATALVLALGLAALATPDLAGAVSGLGAGDPRPPVATERLVALALSHAGLAFASLVVAALAGVAGAILVTRARGAAFRPIADSLAAAAQAVPPVVVVALAFPVLGFGAGPTALALVLYCFMPMLRGTVAAIEQVPSDAREAARGLGFTPAGILWRIELPPALPLIGETLRVAAVVAVATAAIGALAGAATLGTPIITGLQTQNDVQILQGAAATAALAFLADALVLAALSLAIRDET